MEEVKAKRFKTATEMFQPGFQQDVIAYLDTIEHQGFTIQDIKDFHEYRVQEIKQEEQQFIDEVTKRGMPVMPCPECPAVMFLYTVNTEPGDQTGDPNDKSMWMCQNQECMETIYNKETSEEITKEFSKKE